jgi:heat shock protein HtpX
MTLYTHQSENIAKTWVLMFSFLVVVIVIGWLASFYFNNPLILYIAIIFSIGMNISSYWFSDKIMLSMSRAEPVSRQDHPELWNVVENLSITAGLPMPKIYIIPDGAPNAFATGRNKEHAVIGVTSGLLPLLSKTELEGVIAHELSHVGNRDILVSTVAVVLVGFVTIFSDFFLRSMFWGGMGGAGQRGGRKDDRGEGNAIMAVIGIIFIILAPIFATLIQLAISRKREFLADASGALLTRYPEGLASALEKIAKFGVPLQKASNATAHLFIENPFGPKARANGLAKLFMTHPPVEERVRVLREG